MGVFGVCMIHSRQISVAFFISSRDLICRHFSLNWAYVDPMIRIQSGVKFCVCEKEVFPWLLMPLEVVYVDESKNSRSAAASFSFGSGTLRGHLLVLFSYFPISIALTL